MLFKFSPAKWFSFSDSLQIYDYHGICKKGRVILFIKSEGGTHPDFIMAYFTRQPSPKRYPIVLFQIKSNPVMAAKNYRMVIFNFL